MKHTRRSSLGDVIHSRSFKCHQEPGDPRVPSPAWTVSLNSSLGVHVRISDRTTYRRLTLSQCKQQPQVPPLPHTPTLWFTLQEQAAPRFQSLSPRTRDFSHIPHRRTNLVRSAFRYSQNLTPSPQPPPWTKPAPFSPRLVPSTARGLPPASLAPLQDKAAREISLQHEAGCGPPPSKFSQDHTRKSQDP